jgi:putative ABC transport system permease protein
MPGMLRRLLNRIRYRRFDADIAEELAFHRALKAADPDAGNVDRAMGNQVRMRELAREVWVPPGVDALRQDARDAVRMIIRRPLFTATAVAALVVGVGAATVAFSLLNALLLRPLPVERPHELVYLEAPSFSYPIVRAVHARSGFLSNAFGWNLTQYDALWRIEPEPTLVLEASGTIYETLGIRPLLGRLLTPADDNAADAQAVGVVSYGAWQRRFGGDPAVVGRSIRLQGFPVTIIGVTPPEFFGVAPGRAPEITIPVTLVPRLRAEDANRLRQSASAWLHFMGRLRPGVTREQANAEFQVLWPQVLEAVASRTDAPDRRVRFLSRRTSLVSGATGFSSVRNQFREPLMILAGLAGLLLLVGCATVANMLVAGAWGRSRELAVRLALGCSRGRVARQLLCEGLLLAGLAGVAAMVLAQSAGYGLAALLTTTLEPVTLDLSVDWRVVVFTLGVVALTAMIFSAAPILMAVRVDPGPALKSGSRQVSSQGGYVGRALVAAQIGFSVVLLVGAALFLRSLGHLLAVDPGFDAARLLAVRIDPAQAGGNLAAADRDRAAAFDMLYRSVLDRLRQAPDVVSAGLSLYPPVSDEDGAWTQSVGVDGATPEIEETRTFFNAVGPGYFATVGTRLISGRDVAWTDTRGTERAVIINAALAAHFFGAEDPLGRRITIGRDASRENLTVVGVVADAKYQRLQEPTRRIAYLPLQQYAAYASGKEIFVSVRVVSISERVTAGIRDAIAGADPHLTPRVQRVTDRIRESLVTERLLAVLAIALGACALFLACAGLFGLMSHLVARRTREIGVRLALGAGTRGILREVLGQALVLTGIGLVLGGAIALGGAGWIRGTLHGIRPTDPIAYAAVAVITIALALAAGFLPARRAASIDPMEALRAE